MCSLVPSMELNLNFPGPRLALTTLSTATCGNTGFTELQAGRGLWRSSSPPTAPSRTMSSWAFISPWKEAE